MVTETYVMNRELSRLQNRRGLRHHVCHMIGLPQVYFKLTTAHFARHVHLNATLPCSHDEEAKEFPDTNTTK